MSLYRNIVWFTKGLSEYTKKGFEAAEKYFNKTDLDVNVSGRSYMVTGANSGIGKCCAMEIAKRGGTVHLVCRNKERGEEAKAEIIEQSGNQNVQLHLLDLSNPQQVVQFARTFIESSQPLNVLVNNAGCMVNTREVDEDGLEKNFATNTLGTHLLTTSLIPVLSKHEKPRVILVSSGGMLVQKLDFADLQSANMRKFDGTMVYAQQKRQQVVLTAEYAKKYTSIHFSAMHPGWADTPAVRSAMPDFYEKMKNKLRTAEQGADSLVWLAIVADIKQPSGLFFQDRKPVSQHLPLAWTRSSQEDIDKFTTALDEISQKYTAY